MYELKEHHDCYYRNIYLDGINSAQTKPFVTAPLALQKVRWLWYYLTKRRHGMTVVVNNASGTLVRALKAMAELDGASVYLDDYGYYSKKIVKSVLKADKQMEKERKKGTLKLYNTVDEMFEDL